MCNGIFLLCVLCYYIWYASSPLSVFVILIDKTDHIYCFCTQLCIISTEGTLLSLTYTYTHHYCNWLSIAHERTWVIIFNFQKKEPEGEREKFGNRRNLSHLVRLLKYRSQSGYRGLPNTFFYGLTLPLEQTFRPKMLLYIAKWTLISY